MLSWAKTIQIRPRGLFEQDGWNDIDISAFWLGFNQHYTIKTSIVTICWLKPKFTHEKPWGFFCSQPPKKRDESIRFSSPEEWPKFWLYAVWEGWNATPSFSSSFYIWKQGSVVTMTYWQLGAWFQMFRETGRSGIKYIYFPVLQATIFDTPLSHKCAATAKKLPLHRARTKAVTLWIHNRLQYRWVGNSWKLTNLICLSSNPKSLWRLEKRTNLRRFDMPAEETNALGGDEYRLGFIESQRLRVAGSAAHLRASHGPLLTHIIASKMVQINRTLMSAPIKHHHRVPRWPRWHLFGTSTYRPSSTTRPCGERQLFRSFWALASEITSFQLFFCFSSHGEGRLTGMLGVYLIGFFR